MYSTTLVLWELLSGYVPFSVSGPEYQPVRQEEVRRRILLGERPEVPMVQGDEKFLSVETEDSVHANATGRISEPVINVAAPALDSVAGMPSKTRSKTVTARDGTTSPLYDGYGPSSTLHTEKGTNKFLKIPDPQHIISVHSPYAKYIQLMRTGWADAPDERYTARELYEELHILWRGLCHNLAMFVHYDPNTNSNYNPSEKKNSMLESRLAQATDCVGLRAYHTEYECASKELSRKESNTGSNFPSLVRSNSQADQAFPPLTRTTSLGGVFSALKRSNSQAESKSFKGNRQSFGSMAEGVVDASNTKLSTGKGGNEIIDESATPENFQCILACVQADPSYAALDADGGAWVIVSTSSPHFILRTTSSFCDLLGLSSHCLGSPLEEVLEAADEETPKLKQFLYEMTLFNMHSESVMRRQEYARCTTTIYPSYFCNHLLITVACVNPAEKMTAYGIPSVDSEESGTSSKSDLDADNAASRSSCHSNKSFSTKPVRSSAVFSVNAFPLFGDNPLQKANPSKEVKADMAPVAYALLFSEFKRIVEASRVVPEPYPRTLGGMFGKLKDVVFGRTQDR